MMERKEKEGLYQHSNNIPATAWRNPFQRQDSI